MEEHGDANNGTRPRRAASSNHMAGEKVARLERLDDPGRGVSAKGAQTARERHLRDLERATDALDVLQRDWEASAPEVVEKRSQWEHIRWLGRKHVARELHTAEDNQVIRDSSEALATRQREREAKERLAALRSKRLNPPHADAAEIVAAVMAEPGLFASCEVKLRGNDETGYVNTHALEPAEIGALFVVLHLLRENGSIEIHGMSTSARWPKRDRHSSSRRAASDERCLS